MPLVVEKDEAFNPIQIGLFDTDAVVFIANPRPDLLQKPDYDPFGVMPAVLPDHPRVFTTAHYAAGLSHDVTIPAIRNSVNLILHARATS